MAIPVRALLILLSILWSLVVARFCSVHLTELANQIAAFAALAGCPVSAIWGCVWIIERAAAHRR